LGNGASTPPHVKVFDGRTGSALNSFFAYSPSFSGGVFVASGDLNGDVYDDIVTGAGEGGSQHVKVFSGNNGSEIRSFLAYGGLAGNAAAAEVRVAAGDVNGDGRDDIITGLGSAAPHVKVFDGITNNEIGSFLAYGGFSGGVYVAAGDLDGDGRSDIITGAGAGGFSHVKVFSGATGSELRSFFAYPGVDNEVRVGAGDVNGDGRDDIITALGPGAAPHVKVFSGLDNSLLLSFFAYAPSFTGGVYVAGVTVPEPTSFVLAALSLTALTGRRTYRPNRDMKSRRG
jgi:serralysin